MNHLIYAFFALILVAGAKGPALSQEPAPPAAPAPVDHKAFASFDGHRIHYLDEGEGPVVLLLHGLTLNADVNFRQSRIIDRLVKAGFRIIAPDLRGHGASNIENTPENWPQDAMARDQIALMKHLGADPAAVIGYSMGSIVALRMHLLSRLGDKLVLAGMGHTVALENDSERHQLVVGWLEDAKNGADTETARFIRSLMQQSGSKPDSVAGSHRHRIYVPIDLLQTFDVPTLVLNGDADFDNGSGEQLAGYLPYGEFRTVNGTHMSAINNPALAEAIVDFLED